MNAINKKELSTLLSQAISREEIRTGDAARFLNLNPCYITMMQNEKHWDSAGKAPWDRLILWKEQRCKISEFKIPEGEEIWIPKKQMIIKDNQVPKFKEKPTKTINQDNKPPKFNYDFLNDPTFLNIKEKEAEMMDRIGQEIEKIAQKFKVPAIQFADPVRQKVAIDIEINLVINGQKVQLQ